MTIRVILADDHPVVRQGLRRLLETQPDLSVVAETGDGLETIRLVEQFRPDVLILDLMMPGLNGMEVTRQVMQNNPGIHVIVLSMHKEDEYVINALRNGAQGYLLKDTGPSELAHAIREVIQGERYLSTSLRDHILDLLERSADQEKRLTPYEQLSSREREVFHLILESCTSAEIARRLSISPRTAETHRANLMRKLGVSNQIDLVRFAIKNGLLNIHES
jgi:DNA-binding NarL/FixJ family response regulator